MATEPLDLSPEPAEGQYGEKVIPLVVPTVVAFIGRTERGPLNEPVAVRSFEDYRRVFGGHFGASFVSFAVQHFFLHGGEHAVVVRVANRATRATIAVPAGRDTLRLQVRHPGARELLRVSIDYDRVEGAPALFNLVVQRLNRPGSELVADQELFESLSMDPSDERFVVDALQESEFVRLVGPLPKYRPDATRPAFPGQPIPYIDVTAQGSDGDDLTDYDIIGSNSEGTGLFALDRCEQIDFICVPAQPGRDLGSTSFLAATRYCERRRAVLIADPPWAWSTIDAALLGVRGSAQTSRHALTYFPRVRARGDLGRHAAGMPACGIVAGMLARCDRRGVWHSMPPVDTTLKGSLAPLQDIGPRQAQLLQRLGVNTFVRLQPGIAALQGNASSSGGAGVEAHSQELSVVRLTAFVLRSIERHTRWVFGSRRTPELAVALERQVSSFLSKLKQDGAFVGATAEQAYFVRTSAPAALVDAAHDVALTLRVGFAPKRPNEFVTFDFRYHAVQLVTEVVPVHEAERCLG